MLEEKLNVEKVKLEKEDYTCLLAKIRNYFNKHFAAYSLSAGLAFGGLAVCGGEDENNSDFDPSGGYSERNDEDYGTDNNDGNEGECEETYDDGLCIDPENMQPSPDNMPAPPADLTIANAGSCPIHVCFTDGNLTNPSLGVHVNLDIYFITKDGREPVPQERLSHDVSRLNEEFSGMGLSFERDFTRIIRLERPQYWHLELDEFEDLMREVANDGENGWPIIYVRQIEHGRISGAAYQLSSAGVVLASRGTRYDETDPQGIVSAVAPHEFGHQFGLYHTHETSCGEGECYGSSCRSAGDFICDTLADPYGRESCRFSSDDCYVECENCYNHYNDNIMSYWSDSCKERFTAEQEAVMNCIIRNEFMQ